MAAVASAPGEQAAPVAAGAGAHGKQEAEAARVASEAKVARLALHVDKEDAGRVLGELDGL